MKELFCPWVSETGLQNIRLLRSLCGGKLGNANKKEDASLVDFLTSSSAKTYFDKAIWTSYGNEWKWVALLTLLKLWTTDLEKVNYNRSEDVFGKDLDGFKLERLSSPGGDMLFVEASSKQEHVTTITKYSGEKWTVLLQNGSNHDESGQALSITLSEGQLCIQDLVCLDGSRLGSRKTSISAEMRKLDKGIFGTYLNMLLKDYGYNWDNRRTFMMLAAACFKDIERVSISVQKPSKDGEVVFTQLNNKK